MYHHRAKPLLFFILSFFFFSTAFTQNNHLKGTVIDTFQKKKLQYSIVALVDLSDTSLHQSIRSAENGTFTFAKIPAGQYRLMISYPKMADYLQDLSITDTSKIDLKEIIMVPQSVLLEEVVIRSGAAIRMRGDTLEYTADSFAIRAGANVEELLKRLPGIQVERNGKIIAQGQEVKKVLVDGDEFFGDDPGLVMKYLHADAIDKVQVFDKKSEQSEFTGIDDGSRTKTINLKLKSNKKSGYFGKLAAGADGRQYHNHEALGALFNGPRKMSVFGTSSKTGKAGPSYGDLNKYVAQDYEQIYDGTGTTLFSGDYEYEGDTYYGMGLPSIESGGAHYSNKWNQNKQVLVSNYRIKQVNASGWSSNKSTTTLPDGTGFTSSGESRQSSHSFMQKASGSLTTQLDSLTTVKLSLNGALDNGNTVTSGLSQSKNEKGFGVNNSNNSERENFEGKKLGSNLSYRRRFRKEGRTLSLVIQQQFNEKNRDNENYSENNYFEPTSGLFKNADTLNQLQRRHNSFESYAAQLNFTERLSEKLSVSLDYGWKTGTERNAFNTLNTKNDKYEGIDSLSNDYRFTANTHITGVAVAWNQKKFEISLGAKAYFTGFQQVNNDTKTKLLRNFTNLAPKANARVQFNNNANLSFQYSGQTFQPSAEQLQPLRVSNNPLYTQIGNPDLKPGFRHNMNLYLYKFNPVKGTSFNAGFGMGYTANEISAKTYTDVQNRTISQYINLNSIPGGNGHMGYSWQYKKIHLRPSINASFSRFGNYQIQNDKKIRNTYTNANSNVGVNWDWEKTMTMEYRAGISYNSGSSEITGTRSSYSHNHTINTTIYLPGKLDLGSDCTFNFQPRNRVFNSSVNTIGWNAYLEKRFFKTEMLQAKLSINDILNNNTGYGRSVYGNTVSEYNQPVLKRYWLLTLSWNFSKSL